MRYNNINYLRGEVMKKVFDINEFLIKYPNIDKDIKEHNIDIQDLKEIYEDYMEYRNSYKTQAEFIANILRSEKMIHSVKSRIKEPDRLIEKIIRKTNRSKIPFEIPNDSSLEDNFTM